MQTIQNISTTGWTQLGTSGRTAAIVEALGTSVSLYVGSEPPTATAPGFSLPSGVAVSVPNLAAFGGSLYVRADYAGRSARYIVA